MNWDQPCAYDAAQKNSFHVTARARLRCLAVELAFLAGSYDLRSNQGGIAVSGEITLHHESVYIQVSQSAMGGAMGVLIRTCRGRRDYTGGNNNFAALTALDDVRVLAERIRIIAPEIAALRAA